MSSGRPCHFRECGVESHGLWSEDIGLLVMAFQNSDLDVTI